MAPVILRLVLRVAAIGSLLAIVAASAVPPNYRATVEIVGSGVVEHVIAYAICGFSFVLGFTQRRAVFVFFGLAVLAGLLEFAQVYVPGRHARISDAVMSAAGAGLGILLARFIGQRYAIILTGAACSRSD